MTAETIQKCIESLEDEQQKDFIRQCLVTDPASRPKARDLLFHPVLFEVGRGLHLCGDSLSLEIFSIYRIQVHSLKLLAAHTLVKNPGMN